ncbi:hypothetical protein P170DRAFT_496504 [Aspergillus steynii IBT 23096]|uniref:Tachykinin family protein n=1 Tax=Aspergillus steynii IBT 23096 TaxID=1392250 RepID=A0A2I2G430_9EURO|nr:uncharacterized protein P170DRAFT_496504 [Aspergillus steynii IBT 23096]PLB47637.1 hypothetical protein P170DRAFT_496504 [Aspergillus steynii IBT 23096]
MSGHSSEIVFSVSSSSNEAAYVIPYVNGLMKVPGPRRRGRPAGSTKRVTQSNGRQKQKYNRDLTSQGVGQFQFINLSAQTSRIDAVARRTIRRKAMFNHIQVRSTKVEKASKMNTKDVTRAEGLLSPQSLPLLLGSVDPFNTMPIRFEPYMHDLLVFYSTTVWKTLYSIEEKAGCNPMVEYWLPLAFNDTALLNILIGCAAAFKLESIFQPGCPTFVRHLNEAMNIVNNKLSSMSRGEHVSDEILAVIATLAIIQRTVGSSSQWNMHMGGLQRLVDLRGGMSSLDAKPLIKSKIYRADLCGSLDITRQPYFNPHYDQLPLNNFQDLRLPRGFSDLDEILSLDPLVKNTILNVQASLQGLSILHVKKHHSHAAQIRFSLTSAQYTLLSFPCDSSSNARIRAQETCRLAILLFTATVFHELPPGASIADGTVGRMIELLSDIATCRYLTPAFQTWALCLAVTAAPPGDREQALVLLSGILARIHVDTEEQFAILISSFLGEGTLHQMHCRVMTDILSQSNFIGTSSLPRGHA